MNVKLFFTACIISLVSLHDVAHSVNNTYIDENKVKDCLNTMESLGNNYSKHIFWNSTKTDQLLFISNKLFTQQALLYNSIQALKQSMNYSDETINKFINNARNNPNINLYSSNMMSCDKQLNNYYKINVQNEYSEHKNFANFDNDDLLGFYSKFDNENLISFGILQLASNELKLRITNIVRDILEGISAVEYYKRCFELFWNERFIDCISSINSQDFSNIKNQFYTFNNDIYENKQELLHDISEYCKINQNLSAQELYNLAIDRVIIEQKDAIMNCDFTKNISDVPIFTQNGNNDIKKVHEQNINSIKLMHYLKELNLSFLYNKKSINNMKNIITLTKKYNELKNKIMGKIL